MTRGGMIFLAVLMVNALVSLLYLVWWLIFKKETDNRKQYVMNTVIMLLCPIVGILYFFFAFFKYRFLELGDIDLSDVEFSKKRHIARVKADESRERNIVSVGEAILISDREKKRANMLNVLLGDTDESFSAIALALDSDDSEVAHYAASFLQSKMDTFRDNVRKTVQQIDEGDIGDEECRKLILNLIQYMNHMLKQNVFTKTEQTDYVRQMEQLCETLFQNARNNLTSECYEWLIGRITELKEYDKAELWENRFFEQYPDLLAAYTLRLKLYFETGHKDKFFEVLTQLQRSSVAVDSKTLELIRMVQQ
jgi:flagellar basal body-associated protein FliL